MARRSFGGQNPTAGPVVGVVPNFSEGRRADVVEAICDALQVPGARLVHRQADPDHHRLDTTVLGPPAAVTRSAMSGAATAIELIDMDQHRGAHPRIGAVDVIPFMPVRGVAMGAVIGLARNFGRELADTLAVPVYLYERAALVPERRSLAAVRQGGYEGLRDDVARGERLPDFGPSVLGKAGAVAVGARRALVAFNVYVDADPGRAEPAESSEDAVKAVAKEIRESSGGLPAVRAIGFAVPERGCWTVSMNLLDHEITGLRRAFDEVVARSSPRGLRVIDSEIVGLVPEAALRPGDADHVRLTGFDTATQVLERRLEEDP